LELLTWPRKKEVLVSNLRWQVLDPFADKLFMHDQINQMLAEGYRYFLKYKNGADINMGFTSSTAHEGLLKFRVYSIAAKVATHMRFKGTTTLALLRIDFTEEPMAYAVGLVDGNVVMDEQLPISDIAACYSRFAGLCESSGRLFYTHGDIAPDGLNLNHPFTLSELVEGGKGKKIKLEKLQDDKKIQLVILAATAVIVIFMLMWLWDWYELDRKRLEDQLKSALQTPAYLYDAAVKTVLAQDHLLLPPVTEEISEQLRQFPVQLDGWTLSRITCTQVQCQLSWQSTGGTFEDFARSAPPSWGKFQPGGTGTDNTPLGDLKTLQSSLKLKLTSQKLPLRATWPSREEFLLQMGVNLQKLKDLNWTMRFSPVTQQAVPPQIPPQQVADHPQAIYAMSWQVANADWPLTRDIFATLGTNFTLNEFSFQINESVNTVTFSASGLAYVRK
jgi:hypothetical protein